MTRMTHMDVVAARKAGNIDGWEPCSYAAVNGGIIIKGGVPRRLKTGKNAGKKRWDGPLTTVVVTEQEVDAQRARYEAKTGKCHECYGEGRRAVGWSRNAGTMYKPCARCCSTGKAPAMAQSPDAPPPQD